MVVNNFDLSKTLESGQCFHFEKLRDQKYLIYGENSFCVATQEGNNLILETDNYDYWIYYLSLDVDYNFINNYLINYATKEKDTFAIEVINFSRGIRILRQPLFETACSYIISQQNRIPRIQKMVFSLSEKYSKNIKYLKEKTVYLFPSHQELSLSTQDELKNIGLGYRAQYIVDFCKAWPNIQNQLSQNYEKDKEILKSCNGIGEKVANCICLYGLEELDSFPIDTWIKKILNEHYPNGINLPDKYAGILQQYMFFYKRNYI